MRIVKCIHQLKSIIECLKDQNIKTGFVPTMGALHEGHLSLISESDNDHCYNIVSIFLNPLQFGKNEDLDKYPKPLERDIMLCQESRVNLLFLPDTKDIYKGKEDIYIVSESLAKLFCGITRPTHFRGVLTIVAKLLNIIEPDIAYFGEKDYQQAVLIKNMVRELNFKTVIKVCRTVREESGLALSSRNSYLIENERKMAQFIYRSFKHAEELIKNKSLNKTEHIIAEIKDYLQKKIDNIIVEYVDIVYDNTLERAEYPDKDIRILCAVKINQTRLIDNYKISI